MTYSRLSFLALSGNFPSASCFFFFSTSSGFDPNQREERGNPMGEESHLLNSYIEFSTA